MTGNLKCELFNRLKSIPVLDDFFRDMLEARVSVDNWLENPLVRKLLEVDNVPHRIDNIQNYLEAIQKNKKLFNNMKAILRGNEKDFDQQMFDLFAELNACYWLHNNGFKLIQKIKEIKKSGYKTPDFSAEKNGQKYLFEVKHLRAPSKFVDLAWAMIEARHLENPSLYSGISFHIEDTVTEELRPKQTVNDNDRCEIEKFITKIEDSLLRDEVGKEYPVEHSYKRGTVDNGQVYLKCTTIKWSEFCVMWGNESYNTGEPDFHERYLVPLAEKFKRVIDCAIEQLFSYDKDNDCHKIILIDWTKTMLFLHCDSLHEELKKILASYDQKLNTPISKLSLKLL